jgi:hypothetical protein
VYCPISSVAPFDSSADQKSYSHATEMLSFRI